MKRELLLAGIALLTMQTQYAQDLVHDGIAYNFLGDSSLEVTSLPDNEKYAGEVHIPYAITFGEEEEPICGMPGKSGRQNADGDAPVTYYVVRIGEGAFKDCPGLTKLEMPHSVREVGAEAVSGCSGLEEVTLPEILDTLGDSAFESSRIGSMSMSREIKEMGDRVFYGLDISCLDMGSCDLERLGREAFANSTIKMIQLPRSLGSISEAAFDGCRGLKYAGLGESLEEICSSAFSGCEALRALSLPSSVRTVAADAFEGVSLDAVSLGFSEAPGFAPTVLFGDHVPTLLAIRADFMDALVEWWPGAHDGKASLLISGEYAPYCSKWIYAGIAEADDMSAVIPEGVLASEYHDVVALVTSGGNLSVCLPRFYGGGYDILVNGERVIPGEPDDISVGPFYSQTAPGFIMDSLLVHLEDITGNWVLEVADNGVVGVESPLVSAFGLSYDGQSVSAGEGYVALRNMAGQTVAAGHGSVSTAGLKSGVYVATGGGKTVKILVR